MDQEKLIPVVTLALGVAIGASIPKIKKFFAHLQWKKVNKTMTAAYAASADFVAEQVDSVKGLFKAKKQPATKAAKVTAKAVVKAAAKA